MSCATSAKNNCCSIIPGLKRQKAWQVDQEWLKIMQTLKLHERSSLAICGLDDAF
jgi:hypothetical protein